VLFAITVLALPGGATTTGWAPGEFPTASTAALQPRATAAPALSLSISPITIDPATKQAVTITYTNTVPVYMPRVTVYNNKGAVVRVLVSNSMIGTRTRTTTWNGTLR